MELSDDVKQTLTEIIIEAIRAKQVERDRIQTELDNLNATLDTILPKPRTEPRKAKVANKGVRRYLNEDGVWRLIPEGE